MTLKKITGSVDRIKEILERWENIPEISNIERELVLDKLKQIYEEVMFFKHETETKEDERRQEAEPQSDRKNKACLSEKSDEKSDLKIITSDQILFEEEAMATPRPLPVDKDTILSLYGNDPAITHVKPRPLSSDHKTEPVSPSQDQQKVHEPEKSEGVQCIDEEFNPELSKRRLHNPIETAVPKKILGEVIGNGNNVAFNEALGKQNGHCDIASKIRRQNGSDLRHSIGLNDKFILIKELFGGDSVRYEEVITTLDTFTDLDDALIHIQETYSWNPDCEGIKLLVDLIERKLG